MTIPIPIPVTLSAAFPGRREVVITSFGYGHAAPPEADAVYDARRSLRNPHHDPAMRYRTGLEPMVRQHVLGTPGAADTVRALAALATGLLPVYDTPHGRPLQVAIGCVGGRHRSVALAEALGALLGRVGIDAEVIHRDVTRPVLAPGAHHAADPNPATCATRSGS